jgi:hypothetical protein
MVYDLRSKDDETAYRPSSVRAVPEHDLLFGLARGSVVFMIRGYGQTIRPPTDALHQPSL